MQRLRRETVDLHNGEFCVDVSTYGSVTFEATPREKCDTTFQKQCETKTEQVCFIFFYSYMGMNSRWHTTHKEQLSSRLLVHTKKLWLSQPQKQLTSVAALLTIDNFLRLFLQHFGVCGMGDDDDNDCVCRVTQSKKITLFLHYYPITNFPHVFFMVANLVFFDGSEGYFSHF